jgi:alpha-amylase
MYFSLINVFAKHQPMTEIVSNINYYRAQGLDLRRLATFVGNHDNPRFLSINSNVDAFRSALVFNYMSLGIPIGYYGEEQLFDGGRTKKSVSIRNAIVNARCVRVCRSTACQ